MDVNKLLQDALAAGASDIHIEPLDDAVRIRWRRDGVLCQAGTLHKGGLEKLVSRIKVLAGLDIANRRLPQDGRIVWKDGERRLDLRVSTLPTVRGEKSSSASSTASASPWLSRPWAWTTRSGAVWKSSSAAARGSSSSAGPTGSGKTTTLYAAIHEIQDDSVSIATLEDPVEILMEGISQSQVQAKGGMMFQDGLRALLRQDPDILVVGEIRDGETARIAVRAALTGHVIFSTLHAPSAVEAVIRLTDMGVAPYLAADALAGVVSQRLVRCRRSDGSYQGRFCLCEVVPAGRRLRDAIRRCAGVRDLTDAARSDGAVLLPDVIARTLAAGRTDEREIRRVCEGGSSW